MARVFYSMAGEGRGHATRVETVVEALRHEHKITLFAPGDAFALLAPRYANTPVTVEEIPCPRFDYHGPRLDFPRTARNALGYLRRLPALVDHLGRRIQRDKPDLVITDFEPALPRAARRQGVPFISLDHQHFLVICDLSTLPGHLRAWAWRMGWIVRSFVHGQTATIVSSFFAPPLKTGQGPVKQVGVLLRPEVLAARPRAGDGLVAYFRRFAPANVLDALRRAGRRTRIYGLGERAPDGNLEFAPLAGRRFLDDLADCSALVSTAGNQLLGEALFLGKPVLALPEPNNPEQYINGHFLKESGGGEWAEMARFGPERLDQFLGNVDHYRARIDRASVVGNEPALAMIQEFLHRPGNRGALEVPPPARPPSLPPVFRVARAALTLPLTIARARARRPDWPRFLTHTVTFRCNARCVMCDSWKMESDDDLTLDEIGKIYRQLPAMDAVRLTGGEPFVRNDFRQIADLVRRHLRPLTLHVTTNGFLTDRIVRFCEARNRSLPLELLVSIDGVGAKHNAVRGSDNAWNSVLETLRALAPRRRELGLRLGVNQTIVDAEGIEHYRRLREVLRPLEIHNNVVMAYGTSATYNLERNLDLAAVGEFTTFGAFAASEVRELIAAASGDLGELRPGERLAKRYYLMGLENRLLEGKGSPNPPCVALNAHMRLFPNGDVPTCQFNSHVVGNLRRENFKSVWKSALAQAQRRWVARCPGCWAECEVVPNAIYSGDLLRVLAGRETTARERASGWTTVSVEPDCPTVPVGPGNS